MRKIGFHFKLSEALLTWKDYDMGVGYEVCFMDRKRGASKLEFAWLWTKQLINVLPCWLLGHDIVEGGHAGPDYGEITWDCKRCGWGGSYTLY